jgi:hypothetical protein
MVIWKSVKGYIPGQTSDTKEYFEIWSQAVYKEYITNNGKLNEIGYGMYLTLLGVTGKKSVFNSPIRKQYVWFVTIDDLLQLMYVVYDEVNYNYNLTSKGLVMLEVLARTLMNKGIPKI